MRVFLTGGTGFIGTAILKQLIDTGHDVTALVRSDESAAKVTAAGAAAIKGDITNIDWLMSEIAKTDGAIHTAAPNNDDNPTVDTAMAKAATAAFAGTGKPYVHTSGIWIYGASRDITEESSFNPPPMTAWRHDVEAIALGGAGVRASVVVPGVVYGYGKGLTNVIAQAPRAKNGGLTLIGGGSQHWATVHTDDLANVYILALERGIAGNYYLGASGNPTVGEIATALSHQLGLSADPQPETPDASRARLGTQFADALLLDQMATAAKTRGELRWVPTQPSLIEVIEAGGYGSTA